MARSFAKLLVTIWRDPDFTALPIDEQRLYMTLLSQPDLSACGALPVRFTRWARLAPDTTPEGIADTFGRLVLKRFVCVDDTTEEALIRSFIRHDGGHATPNIHKAIVTAIGNLESAELQTIAHAELAKAAGHKPCETHPPTHNPNHREGIAEQSSLQPSASTFSQQPSAAPDPLPDPTTNPHLPPAAAAAIEILIAHRTITARDPIENIKRYARKIRTNIDPDDQRALIAEAATDATPETIAARVFGLSRFQIAAATAQLNRQAIA